jgi:hypothetical protein
LDGAAPEFQALETFSSGTLTFQSCEKLTGAPSFPALETFTGGTINFSGLTNPTGAPSFSALKTFSTGTVTFQNCKGLDGAAPEFQALETFSSGTLTFQSCEKLTGAPSFPVLTTFNGGTINFQDCKGLDGTVDFSGLQTVGGSVNFSGCTNLAGITLENCVVSTANWSKFNFTNTGITTVNLSGSELSGTLDMTKLTNLTTLILTGCTGTPAFKLHSSRQALVNSGSFNIIDAPATPTITY